MEMSKAHAPICIGALSMAVALALPTAGGGAVPVTLTAKFSPLNLETYPLDYAHIRMPVSLDALMPFGDESWFAGRLGYVLQWYEFSYSTKANWRVERWTPLGTYTDYYRKEGSCAVAAVESRFDLGVVLWGPEDFLISGERWNAVTQDVEYYGAGRRMVGDVTWAAMVPVEIGVSVFLYEFRRASGSVAHPRMLADYLERAESDPEFGAYLDGNVLSCAIPLGLGRSSLLLSCGYRLGFGGTQFGGRYEWYDFDWEDSPGGWMESLDHSGGTRIRVALYCNAGVLYSF